MDKLVSRLKRVWTAILSTGFKNEPREVLINYLQGYFMKRLCNMASMAPAVPHAEGPTSCLLRFLGDTLFNGTSYVR